MAVDRRDLERRRAESAKRRRSHKISVLSTPKAPTGWRYYWANRFRDNGKDDVQNFLLKQREGFEFVTPEELAKTDPTFSTIQDETASNRIVVGDLVLMKIKLEAAEDLEFAEEDQARSMVEASKRDLLNSSSEQMPVIDKSSARVTNSSNFA